MLWTLNVQRHCVYNKYTNYYKSSNGYDFLHFASNHLDFRGYTFWQKYVSNLFNYIPISFGSWAWIKNVFLFVLTTHFSSVINVFNIYMCSKRAPIFTHEYPAQIEKFVPMVLYSKKFFYHLYYTFFDIGCLQSVGSIFEHTYFKPFSS